MITLGPVLAGIPIVLFAYAYLAYPLLLRLLAKGPSEITGAACPSVTITVPAYNEGDRLGATLDQLLALDYPADRRHILVVSDASTDATDEVARMYADRGVELLRLDRRGGKTAAENASAGHVTGDIVVNVDATIGLEPHSLRALLAVFADPTIGVASGRDVSVGDVNSEGNRGESNYVGYEMRIRQLETRVSSIVGASGCFYAMRRALHAVQFPEDLSRDFGAVLVAHEHGFRSVSVPDAVCYVPRTTSLAREYRRKVRTMARGLRTLWYKRSLLNPVREGVFAWMLWSHKLCRWLVPLSLLPAGVGLIMIGVGAGGWGWLPAALALVGLLLGLAGLVWPAGRRSPAVLSMAAYGVAGNLAGIAAWFSALSGTGNRVWEPTRRPNGRQASAS